jgi:ankyrin repeat protein
VQYLLNHGAKLESTDKDVWTHLNSTAKNGNLEVVRELLKRGAKM